MGAVAVAFLLAVPLGHQVHGHRVLRPGHELEPLNELAHRARPRPLRLAADLAWLAYLAGVVVLAVVLKKV